MTLAISLVALLMSVLALSWQVWTWRRSIPRLEVSVAHGTPVFTGAVGRSHTIVEVANQGQADAAVTSFGFELPNGLTLEAPRTAAWSSSLPAHLGPNETAGWHVPTASILEICHERDVDHRELRAWVDSAKGRVYARTRGINHQDLSFS
ncbi:hypothetical protein [Amycolatopsis magusensis]|uniref:hypothetical protein n=1 Tax=Amycolatopsis magusensis TaxID=882444 RepID=UPI003790B853